MRTRIKEYLVIDYLGKETIIYQAQQRVCFIWIDLGEYKTYEVSAKQVIDDFLKESRFGINYIKYPEDQ